MTIAKMKPSGFGPNDELTSAEIEICNSQMPNFMDGAAGGTYTPSAPLIVAGAQGLACSGVLNITGTGVCTIALAASLVINGTCTVGGTGSQTFASGATLTTAAGSTSTFNGTCTFNENFSLNSAKTFSCAGTLALGSTGSITGAAGSTVNLTGTAITLGVGTQTVNQGTIVNFLTGHVNDRLVDLTDANQTIGISSGTIATNGADVVMLAASVLSADRVITVTSTGALRGSRMRFSTDDNTFKLTLKNDNGVTFAFVKTPPAAGNYQWIDIIHSGAANGWRICGGLWA